MERNAVRRNLDVFSGEEFDLLIVGGGITGAGVALDAALNGCRVAVIDKGDFASATSSASSKLVHGGLRYLEHGDIRLVHEALHERRLLLQNAPHLVHPLRFILPFYERSRVRPWKWRLGLTLYDALAGASNIRRSRPLSRDRLRREVPTLRTAGLLGGAEYYDAQMDDARLCLEVLRSADGLGARAANYVEAVGFERRGGQITGVRAVDRLGGRELVIRARQVLNATGPGVDALCRLAGDTGGPRLQPTKGVHIVAPPLGLAAAFLLLHPADGRVFFVIPWMGVRGADGRPSRVFPPKTLIGTTDTLFREGVDTLEVTAEEVRYLLEGYNHHFTRPLSEAEILGRFAGLRPLLRTGTNDPAAMSREFQIFDSASGLLSVAGGKYTTYRHMAEVIAEAVAQRLGRPHRRGTQHFALDGSPREPWCYFERAALVELGRRHGLAEDTARHLLRRYGRRAVDVATYWTHDPKLAEPVVPGEPDLRAELPYQRDREMAIRPADFLLRRTRLGLFHPELLATPPAGIA
jgi:glycerol-3-phosphate dehydrogenase